MGAGHVVHRRERLAAGAVGLLLSDRGPPERTADDDLPEGARRAAQLPGDDGSIVHRTIVDDRFLTPAAAAGARNQSSGPAGLGPPPGEHGLPVLRLLRPRRRRGRKLGRLLAIGVALLLGLLYYRPAQAYLDTHKALQARTTEVRALTARKRQLESRLSEIERGATLVRGARRLGLVKPGERLFIVRGIPEWRRAHSRR